MKKQKIEPVPEPVPISFSESPSCITVEKLPEYLRRRGHFEYKNKIFVRTCYEEIYEVIRGEIQVNIYKKATIACQNNQNNNNNNNKVEVENQGNRSNVFAVIGTSGIGKSVFFCII